MRKVWLVVALILSLLIPSGSFEARQRGAHRSSTSSLHSSSGSHSHARPRSRASTGAARVKHGRIKRSAAAKHEFMKQTGYPHGRKGYVIDHKIPLACGGADDPSNMQWQTVAGAKAKDKWERRGCK